MILKSPQDAHVVLKSSSPDDVLLSVLMFLSGLLGLARITSRCASLLSPHPDNLVSVLSAVPALLANRIQIPWSSDLEALTSRDVGRECVQEIWDRHDADFRHDADIRNDADIRAASSSESQRNKKTDKFDTETILYCGVCAYVLVDKTLSANEQAYNIIEKCTSLSLKAAFTKLKSWKNTSMSIRALL